MTSRPESFAKRITPTLLLLLALGGVLLIATPSAATDPNNANCKPNRATCTSKRQCCSGFCDPTGLCAVPPTTTTTSTSTTTTTSTTSTTAPTTTTTTTSTTTTTTPRFVDNGDGTVTDNQTGLQWEQKVTGSSCLHCVNDTYSWTGTGTAPDGTAFTSFLNTLNGGATGVGDCTSGNGSTQTGGFDNHCDWRLPTIAELRTIVDTSASGCGSGSPCIDPIFGPTAASTYWSSTTFAGLPGIAWGVGFAFGDVDVDGKTFNTSVRAVRGGS